MSNVSKIQMYFKELLEDLEEHSKTELFDYAKRRNPEANYTEGMLTGALKTLVDGNVNYVCVSRNTYKYVSSEFLYKLETILKDTVDEIEGIKVNPLLFIACQKQKDDICKMKKVQECLETIKETITYMKY